MGSQVPQYTQSVCQTTKMLNMLKLLLLLASTCTIFAINPFRAMFPEIKTHKVHSHKEVGDPLFLTPMLKDGKIKEAQEASVVKLPEAPHIPSFAGFITVNELFQSNMFFWYFPAAYDFENAPVVLWLQGGPGGSSLFGLFAENGPFSVNEKLELVRRNTAWSLTHNVIYIDNPVGTGFSFTTDGYAENQTAVGEDLFDCLTQIFTLFPNLQDNDFFVPGESYAGKYIPAISYKIHQANKDLEEKDRKINFKVCRKFRTTQQDKLRSFETCFLANIIQNFTHNYQKSKVQREQFTKLTGFKTIKRDSLTRRAVVQTSPDDDADTC